MGTPSESLRLQFLDWLAERPRTYADAMEAWRTSCPRLTIWEDALSDGLIAITAGASRDQAPVILTGRGKAVLAGDRFDAVPGGPGAPSVSRNARIPAPPVRRRGA